MNDSTNFYIAGGVLAALAVAGFMMSKDGGVIGLDKKENRKYAMWGGVGAAGLAVVVVAYPLLKSGPGEAFY